MLLSVLLFDFFRYHGWTDIERNWESRIGNTVHRFGVVSTRVTFLTPPPPQLGRLSVSPFSIRKKMKSKKTRSVETPLRSATGQLLWAQH